MDYEKKDFRKLYEDLVKSEWFKKAYHDKSLGDCPFNIPELAESEDERIRKDLITYLKSVQGETLDLTISVPKWITYLEKQKESLHIAETCKENADSFTDKDEKMLERVVESLTCYRSKVYDEGEGELAREIDEEIDWVQAWKEQKKPNAKSPSSFGDEETIAYHFGLEEGIRREREKQKEQKPVEIDEDVKLGLDRALQIVEKAKGNLQGYQTDDGIYECDHAIGTLKHILKSGIKQKPAEWSEEDEKMINDIIYCLPKMAMGNIEMLPSVAEQYANRLKSLRPQPKQDKGPIAKFVQAVEDVEQYRKGYEEGLRDGMKRHWKPSEEQMEALCKASDLLVSDLNSLYNDLKKLM